MHSTGTLYISSGELSNILELQQQFADMLEQFPENHFQRGVCQIPLPPTVIFIRNAYSPEQVDMAFKLALNLRIAQYNLQVVPGFTVRYHNTLADQYYIVCLEAVSIETYRTKMLPRWKFMLVETVIQKLGEFDFYGKRFEPCATIQIDLSLSTEELEFLLDSVTWDELFSNDIMNFIGRKANLFNMKFDIKTQTLFFEYNLK